MDRRDLLRGLLRLVLAWVGLTLAVLACGAPLLLLARPVLEFEVEALMPDYIVSVGPRPPGSPLDSGDVVMIVHAVRAVPISGDHVVAPWIDVKESINAGHDLVPVIILLSALLAWPWHRWRGCAAACGTGMLASCAILAWTVPTHLAGLYELNLQHVAAALHESRPEPWFLHQMIFFESGGMWLLPLVVAAATGLYFNHVHRRSPLSTA